VGKAIRKNMKTKGEPIVSATNAEKSEGRRGYTPVVTGSMRNRMRAQGIEAPRGAYDGGIEGWRGCAEVPPGCFCKRVWICLIAKELIFLATTKSPQEVEGARVKAGVANTRAKDNAETQRAQSKRRVRREAWGAS